MAGYTGHFAKPAPRAPTRKALILGFATIYLVWGSTYAANRVAVETIPPFLMAGARFFLAGLMLFAFLLWRGTRWPTGRQWRANAVNGILLLTGGNGLLVWAMQVIPSGVAALLYGIAPLCVVLTEWAWPGGIRPSAIVIAALIFGFGGVVWLAAPWTANAAESSLNPAGILAVLSACVCWGVGSIYSRHATHGASPLLSSALQMLIGGGAMLFIALTQGEFGRLDIARINPASWSAFGYLVTAGSLIAFPTFVWLVKHSPPARVATFAYVNPVVALFLGWLILSEPVTPRLLLASAVIVAAVATIVARKGRAPAEASHGDGPTKYLIGNRMLPPTKGDLL
jgi:drug/metabolite transporter (DMT)-like permease